MASPCVRCYHPDDRYCGDGGRRPWPLTGRRRPRPALLVEYGLADITLADALQRLSKGRYKPPRGKSGRDHHGSVFHDSHMCHTPACQLLLHIIWELGKYNVLRNGCVSTDLTEMLRRGEVLLYDLKHAPHVESVKK